MLCMSDIGLTHANPNQVFSCDILAGPIGWGNVSEPFCGHHVYWIYKIEIFYLMSGISLYNILSGFMQQCSLFVRL